MTEADEPADRDKPTDGDRPLWALSRDEQRLLWITPIGGAAGVVLGAGIIGGALALARLIVRFEGYMQLGFATVLVFLLVVGDTLGRVGHRWALKPVAPNYRP